MQGVTLILEKDGPTDGVLWEVWRDAGGGNYTLEEATGTPGANNQMTVGPMPEGNFNARESWNQLPVWNLPISPDESGYFDTLGRGNPTQTLNFVNRETKVRGCKTLDDGTPVPGVTVALFTSDDLFVTNDTTGEDGCYEISQFPPGDYFIAEAPFHGMAPILPPGGRSEVFTISRTHWEQVINLVNRQLEVIYVPIICRNCGVPKPACVERWAELTWTNHFGQTVGHTLVFSEGAADEVSIGTGPYGTKVKIAMTDSQPLDFVSLRFVDPNGAHYEYPDVVGLGPSWVHVGVFERDSHIVLPGELRAEPRNIYSWHGYFIDNGVQCSADVEFQFDPPAFDLVQLILAFLETLGILPGS
jgi:hypothetical protein